MSDYNCHSFNGHWFNELSALRNKIVRFLDTQTTSAQRGREGGRDSLNCFFSIVFFSHFLLGLFNVASFLLFLLNIVITNIISLFVCGIFMCTGCLCALD